MLKLLLIATIGKYWDTTVLSSDRNPFLVVVYANLSSSITIVEVVAHGVS
jgi:hypothetical protein